MANKVVTISEAKQHLRVDQDYDDELIKLYIDAAHDYIENLLNTGIPGLSDSPPEQEAPAAIKSAALLIVSDLYLNREGASEKDIKENSAVMRLLYPYREEIGI
jgi:uncharacterized phage protein (predicted DNA packaging)